MRIQLHFFLMYARWSIYKTTVHNQCLEVFPDVLGVKFPESQATIIIGCAGM